MSHPLVKRIINVGEPTLAPLPAHYRVTCPSCLGSGPDVDGDGNEWVCEVCHGEGHMTFSVCKMGEETLGWHYEGRCLVSFADESDARAGIIEDRWTYRGLQHNGLRDARVLDVLQIPRWTDDCGIERMVEQRPWDGLAKAARS
jgi:hypothetical protein